MRCLTLADELKRRGMHTCFLSRHMPDHLREMLKTRQHELELLGHDEIATVPVGGLAHSEWLGVSQERDAQDTILGLSGRTWNWLVVDHYALDRTWESAIRPAVGKILVIDDIADRVHDCDLLLDQNYYRDMERRYTGLVPQHSHLLLGPRYALLRSEFRCLHEQVSPRSGAVKRILVFFGGVDAGNFTGKVIHALSEINVSGMQVDVVIGAQHPSKQAIEEVCRRLHFSYHVQTDRLADLMSAADIAIGAGGVSTWERCCVGLPAIAVCVADNQQRQLQDAALFGLVSVPTLDGNFVMAIGCQIQSLLQNACLRQMISEKCMETVDGNGVRRTLAAMELENIAIRPANKDDSDNLFKWRNHPSIRAFSRNSDPIDLADHEAWLAAVLKDPDRVLLIGELEGETVGVVRFDVQEDRAEISIYVVPNAQHQGLGSGLLRAAESWLVRYYPQVKGVEARVLGANTPSNQLFLKAGYDVESTTFFTRLH
jgi:UDP-2,4-diacetamido-2,4,6-trideoxy-beta-L-altropyranose hydrolase